ncbi:MAG: hypothetical protein IT342_12690 [Candidatus Melainabacteria bacterium]|nr:hypothetical protein [Candidatus Melainabacteria bacterium]
MVDTDIQDSRSPKKDIPSIAEMARGSKDNLMAISYSQRPKTPMRTYVVTTALVGALGISLGFGIYLMFNPDHSEYSASTLEGTPSVEHDQVLISGLKKVVPMHNAPGGHNPTFGTPRKIEFLPEHQVPISNSVPPPLINHLPPAPAHHFAPVAPMPSSYAPGAASAAVPLHPSQEQGRALHPPVFDAPQADPPQPLPLLPQQSIQACAPQFSQGFVIKNHRLKMVTNR